MLACRAAQVLHTEKLVEMPDVTKKTPGAYLVWEIHSLTRQQRVVTRTLTNVGKDTFVETSRLVFGHACSYLFYLVFRRCGWPGASGPDGHRENHAQELT